MRKITVYCEVENNKLSDVSYELISKASELKNSAKTLADKDNDFFIVAVALASSLEQVDIKKAYEAGCDRFVHIKDSCFDIFVQTVYSEAFMEYYSANLSEIILFPATPKGRVLAPRITTRCKTGLVADCTNIEFILKNDELKLAATRPTFGSELMATILSKSLPQCATIRPKVFKATFNMEPGGEFIEYKPKYSFNESCYTLLSSIREKTAICNYSDAKIVLAAGYGLAKDRSAYDRLKKIAQITGAKFASTRKVVDLGYVEKQYQIGQTGSSTEADVYIAFGISGAIQHIAGMKNCKKIISVNTDKDADIFKYSDYKIVADATEVINSIYTKLVSNLG